MIQKTYQFEKYLLFYKTLIQSMTLARFTIFLTRFGKFFENFEIRNLEEPKNNYKIIRNLG